MISILGQHVKVPPNEMENAVLPSLGTMPTLMPNPPPPPHHHHLHHQQQEQQQHQHQQHNNPHSDHQTQQQQSQRQHHQNQQQLHQHHQQQQDQPALVQQHQADSSLTPHNTNKENFDSYFSKLQTICTDNMNDDVKPVCDSPGKHHVPQPGGGFSIPSSGDAGGGAAMLT